MEQINKTLTDAGVGIVVPFKQELLEDTAPNADGDMTTDPYQALSGVLAVWAGAKGSGLLGLSCLDCESSFELADVLIAFRPKHRALS
jgi:hypothetical protein